ncbi:HET-domain-containing protein [Corynespora cassiicola Philippines]|uniref:HET-domain-containing protein n=1 Tax=Corynespora cassiicola Philippines TaxID=1448308 RepID=A0A2T2NDB0_CORCC|nr:HET-domain-containing protein [Corynespora cassiicola Philippines]
MSYDPEDLKKLLSGIPSAGPSVSPWIAPGLAMPDPASGADERIWSHFERLEKRMDRMEGTLDAIFDHLRLQAPKAECGKEELKIERHFENLHTGNGEAISAIDEDAATILRQVDDHDVLDRKYEYTSLDTAQSQVRILRLNRAEEYTDPLVADLTVVSLDDSIVGGLMYGYTALSYCWGPPVFNGSILLDGCKFPITKSLESALRQLRSSYKHNPTIEINSRLWGHEFWGWIDQICINQADLDERASQVSLMRRIYKRATLVQVWLGEEADDSSVAIDLLNALGSPPKNAPGEKTIHYPTFDEDDVSYHWNALRALFKRPWWERVWIRQEIALHYTVKMWCGDKSFDMNALGSALFMLKHISSLGYASTTSYSEEDSAVSLPWDYHPEKLLELRQFTGNGQIWVGLAQLLRITRSCKATDARDTVFSVLGMTDPELYSVIPDYRQELNNTLVEATKAAINVEFGLELLGACQNPEKRHGLPSWVPFLLDRWRALPFQTRDSLGNRFVTPLTNSNLPNAQFGTDSLLLEGNIVDTVGSICQTNIRNNTDIEEMEFVYSAWIRFVEDAYVEGILWSQDATNYIECLEPDKSRNWIRFITVLLDNGMETQAHYTPFGQRTTIQGPDTSLLDPVKNPQHYMHINPRLARSYLLPSSHLNAGLHRNHRIHAGLRAYGAGRHLCITTRGLLAMIPAESKVGDPIALFEGATFPYVLQRAWGKHVVVGEAFIPSWVSDPGTRNAESLARAEWQVELNALIELI